MLPIAIPTGCEGIEPPSEVLETPVLPLHQQPIFLSREAYAQGLTTTSPLPTVYIASEDMSLYVFHTRIIHTTHLTRTYGKGTSA